MAKDTSAAFTHAIYDGVLCIFDLVEPGRKSVTNDIDYVLRRLAAGGTDIYLPVVYRDSVGRWDAIKTRKSRFSPFEAFVHVDAPSQKEAVAKALELREKGLL